MTSPASIRTLLSLGLLLLAGTACAQQGSWDHDILRDTFGVRRQAQIDAPLDEVLQGCPRRDCIPAIDAPRFLPATKAAHVDDDDLVMALVRGRTARAYPVSILNFHEVVNDTIAAQPIAITYCPLCGSGLAFRRVLDGKPVELGVSGLLHNSDLILYDRKTRSLWQQITGRAIAGPSRGQTLETVPVTMTTWGEWRRAHPGTEVLSTETGHRRDYRQKTPYGDYDSSERLLFPAARSPGGLRLHPKTVVYGVRMKQGSAAVTERALRAEREVRMRVGDSELRWRRKSDGSVEVHRLGSGEVLVAHRMFWFAWYSFHTDTKLHDLPPAKRRVAEPQSRLGDPVR